MEEKEKTTGAMRQSKEAEAERLKAEREAERTARLATPHGRAIEAAKGLQAHHAKSGRQRNVASALNQAKSAEVEDGVLKLGFSANIHCDALADLLTGLDGPSLTSTILEHWPDAHTIECKVLQGVTA